MKNIRIQTALLLTVAAFFCFSCDKTENPKIKKDRFTGYAQKGPFINGSSVLISELDNQLDQTGRTYSSRIMDDWGSFEQKNIELISNFVQLKVDGYYFNEVTGESSVGQVSLYALSDVSNVNSVNVNVLTHLERARAEYLVKEERLSFEEAKLQARKEVLAIFYLELPEETSFESLNLTNNAVLLAISCILQGHQTTAEMTELMANISNDIRTDGVLDNTDLGVQLATNAKWLVLPAIRQNLEKKYAALNEGVTIPDFESCIQQFLSKTPYEPKSLILYPEMGNYGPNILSDKVTSVKKWLPYTESSPDYDYSIRAETSKGIELKIVIKGGDLGIGLGENWRVKYQEKELVVIETGRSSDVLLNVACIHPADYFIIEFYENGSTEPTRTKRLAVE